LNSKARDDSIVVEHVPHYPKVKGASPATAADTRRKWQKVYQSKTIQNKRGMLSHSKQQDQ
jgi:hypothetical protein